MIRKKNWISFLIAVAVTFGGQGCDFNAAEDAFDDIGYIIELEPINTTVTLQVLDASTLRPISGDVNIAFSGTVASSLVDVYSDNLQLTRLSGGVFSFGVANSVVPSDSSPASLTVMATREGYFSSETTVSMKRTGSHSLVVTLLGADLTKDTAGSQNSKNTSGSSSGGVVSQPVVISTAPTSQTQATATVEIPTGTVLLTSTGTPLTGQLSTELTVFENTPEGLSEIPAAARVDDNGNPISIAGAAFFRVTDSAGNVASSFVPPPPGKFGKNPGCGVEEFQVLIDVADSADGDYSAYIVRLPDWVQLEITGQVANGVMELCVTPDNWAFFQDGQPSDGYLFIVAAFFGPANCELDAATTFTFSWPNNQTQLNIAVNGPGVYYESFGVNPNVALGMSDLTGLSPASSFPPGTYTFTDPQGFVQNAEYVHSCPSASQQLVFPVVPPVNFIDASVTASVACPAGTNVPIVGEISGFALTYQRASSSGAPQLVNSDDVTIVEGPAGCSGDECLFWDHALVTVRGVASGENYLFTAVLGEDTDEQTLRMGANVNYTADDASYVDQCQ